MTLYAQTSPLWSLIFAGRCRDGTATLNELSSTLSDLMSQFRVFQSSHCWPHASRRRCCGTVVAALLGLRSQLWFRILAPVHALQLEPLEALAICTSTPLRGSSCTAVQVVATTGFRVRGQCLPNGRRRCFYVSTSSLHLAARGSQL